eukprot:tig00020554_g10885.t1
MHVAKPLRRALDAPRKTPDLEEASEAEFDGDLSLVSPSSCSELEEGEFFPDPPAPSPLNRPSLHLAPPAGALVSVDADAEQPPGKPHALRGLPPICEHLAEMIWRAALATPPAPSSNPPGSPSRPPSARPIASRPVPGQAARPRGGGPILLKQGPRPQSRGSPLPVPEAPTPLVLDMELDATLDYAHYEALHNLLHRSVSEGAYWSLSDATRLARANWAIDSRGRGTMRRSALERSLVALAHGWAANVCKVAATALSLRCLAAGAGLPDDLPTAFLFALVEAVTTGPAPWPALTAAPDVDAAPRLQLRPILEAPLGGCSARGAGGSSGVPGGVAPRPAAPVAMAGAEGARRSRSSGRRCTTGCGSCCPGPRGRRIRSEVALARAAAAASPSDARRASRGARRSRPEGGPAPGAGLRPALLAAIKDLSFRPAAAPPPTPPAPSRAPR